MNRRHFISKLAALAGAGAVAGTVAAKPAVRRVLYYRCSFCKHVEQVPIRSVRFDLPDRICDCNDGMRLMERFYSPEDMREYDNERPWTDYGYRSDGKVGTIRYSDWRKMSDWMAQTHDIMGA